jgi:hypothetical protein
VETKWLRWGAAGCRGDRARGGRRRRDDVRVPSIASHLVGYYDILRTFPRRREQAKAKRSEEGEGREEGGQERTTNDFELPSFVRCIRLFDRSEGVVTQLEAKRRREKTGGGGTDWSREGAEEMKGRVVCVRPQSGICLACCREYTHTKREDRLTDHCRRENEPDERARQHLLLLPVYLLVSTSPGLLEEDVHTRYSNETGLILLAVCDGGRAAGGRSAESSVTLPPAAHEQ